jgi:hypothetical protein
MTPETADVGSATAGPTLTGTDNEALLQAMRNLWPILSKTGRIEAIKVADKIEPRSRSG